MFFAIVLMIIASFCTKFLRTADLPNFGVSMTMGVMSAAMAFYYAARSLRAVKTCGFCTQFALWACFASTMLLFLPATRD